MKKLFIMVGLFLILIGCSANITYLDLTSEELLIGIGESENIGVIYEPADANIKVKWTSSDSSVASVSEGKVFGVSKGTAIITASYKDFSIDCQVTVVDIQEEFTKIIEKLEYAYETLNEVSYSLIGAWHFGIYDSDDYSFDMVVFWLWFETGDEIGTTSELVNAYNDAYGTDYTDYMVGLMLSGDFSRCVNTVKEAYINAGSFSRALERINVAKDILQSLNSSTEGYDEMHDLYLKVKSYYDSLYEPSGSYSVYLNSVTDIEDDIEELFNSANFYID